MFHKSDNFVAVYGADKAQRQAETKARRAAKHAGYQKSRTYSGGIGADTL